MNIRHILVWGIRNIRKTPLHSFINIFGLVIGLSVFSMILLYLNNQNKIDKYHENIDQIYRIECGFGGISVAPFKEYLESRIPEIENASRMTSFSGLLHYQPEGNEGIREGQYADIIFTDREYLEIFSYPLVNGSIDNALENPDDILLSEDFAKKLFGDESPMGKLITYDSNHSFRVTGIFKFHPGKSSIQTDAIANLDFYKIMFKNEKYLDNWHRYNYETYFVLHQNADPEKVTNKINQLLTKRRIEQEGRNPEDAKTSAILRPYKNIYYAKIMDRHSHGNKNQITIFGIIAVFVFLIAVINYFNISTALASIRYKSMAIRKICGSRRSHLIFNFLAESILLAFVSVVFTVIIVELCLPGLRNFLMVDIQIPYSTPLLIISFLGIPLILGLISGIIPAIYLSRFHLISTLKGEMQSGKKAARFRKILSIIQFSIAVFLIIGTLSVRKQLSFINHYNPGYNNENVLISMLNSSINQHYDAFKHDLVQNPGILNASRCNNFISNANTWTTLSKSEDETIEVTDFRVDTDFMDLFEIKLINGRKFRESDLLKKNKPKLVNAKLADFYGGIDSVMQQKIFGGDVIGIIENIHTKSLHAETCPILINLDTKYVYLLYIKLKNNEFQKHIQSIKSVWTKYAPEYPFDYYILEDQSKESYESEIQFSKVFLIFSLLAILIASMGLFALSSFLSIQKTKEIGIRKALGATTFGIGAGLLIKILSWVFISNLIAIPAAWFFLQKWLNSFVFKTSLSPWIFILSLFISLFIAGITVFYHSNLVARKNPVDSLKYE